MQNQSLRYLAILLSQVVHQSSKTDSLRERLTIMAADFKERMRGKANIFFFFLTFSNSKKKIVFFHTGNRIECDPQVISTFNLLCELVSFFDYYHEQKYQLALEVLANTKLVPLSMGELEECINNFKRLGGEICKVYPDILLAAMDILYAQYKSVKGRDTGIVDTGRDRVSVID